MHVSEKPMQTIRLATDGWAIEVIDQRKLPHKLQMLRVENLSDAVKAISEMWVRGAPLIGITAAYGLCLACRNNPSDENIELAFRALSQSRPTAVNLKWALEQMKQSILPLPTKDRVQAAYLQAARLMKEDLQCSSRIGDHGKKIIQSIATKKKATVRILTHCNAGWLATVDWGTALAPIYKSFDEGIDLMVYVDETRPRNQGASLTAWELGQHGIEHKIIVDNAGGHLMQHGLVDLCLVGSDRVTARGDVCNKIGTYLKALAAKDNQVPFYAAMPYSTIDWSMQDGIKEIPIEERDPREVTHISGLDSSGIYQEISLAPPNSQALNYGFDVTPARLITGLITEEGICEASESGLQELYKSC